MRTVFFDRDGTLGLLSDNRYPNTFTPFDNLAEIIGDLHKAGLLCMVYTNQSCVARGLDGGYDFDAEFKSAGFDDWFICPHDHNDNCSCRKPKAGLLTQAAQKHKLDLSDCFAVGDRLTDIEAGNTSGCKTILVRTGRGKDEEAAGNIKIDFTANDLNDVRDYILMQI